MERTGNWSGSGLRVTGIGHYFPESLVHNVPRGTDGDGRFNAIDQAVVGQVNVRTRGVSGEDETVGYMAVRAAEHALREASRGSDDVDLVVVTNWTDRQWVPEQGPTVAAELGAKKALGFDLCGACTGFVHGVQTAAALVSALGSAQVAVVVCSEQFSRRVRPGSKGELVAGDAAGAVVLEQREPGNPELIDSILFSDGDSAQTIYARRPDGWLASEQSLVDRAVEGNVRVVETLLARNEIRIEDVDWVLPHPGTEPIHQAVRDKLGISSEQFVVTMDTRGNVSSASIPIALSELWQSGQASAGDLVLTPAIGSGFFEGGLLFRL